MPGYCRRIENTSPEMKFERMEVIPSTLSPISWWLPPSGINSLKLFEHWLRFWGFSKILKTKNENTFCVLELGHFMHEMSLISHKLSKAVLSEISSGPNISMDTYHPWVQAYLSPLLRSLLWSPNLIRCSQPPCLWTPPFLPISPHLLSFVITFLIFLIFYVHLSYLKEPQTAWYIADI